MARGRSAGWRSSQAPYAQPAARPLPEDSREGRPWTARRGSRPRLRWPGQRRGRWRPRLARRRPWLGRQPDGTCPPAPPPRPARRSLLLAGLVGSCVGRSRALLCPPPWLRQTTPHPGRGKARARPTLEDSIPPFPPPGGKEGLRPALEAIPGARPGCCVRRCGRAAPPPSDPASAPRFAPTARRPAPGGKRSCGQRARNSAHCQPFQRMPSMAGGRPARGPACAVPGSGPGPEKCHPPWPRPVGTRNPTPVEPARSAPSLARYRERR